MTTKTIKLRYTEIIADTDIAIDQLRDILKKDNDLDDVEPEKHRAIVDAKIKASDGIEKLMITLANYNNKLTELNNPNAKKGTPKKESKKASNLNRHLDGEG